MMNLDDNLFQIDDEEIISNSMIIIIREGTVPFVFMFFFLYVTKTI